MNDPPALVNLGELSRPATALIEKISDAIGGIFRPYQIRRVAEAEAQADLVEAKAQIEITELQRRAMRRLFVEEAQKQSNIESITEKAFPALVEQARPQDMEDDWITNFFDKCRLISDAQMQQLWSRVLAGEANSPGRYSKRTVNALASLDKADAELFGRLCAFGWNVEGEIVPLVYNVRDPIYTARGVTFASLLHLDAIGLLSFNDLSGFKMAVSSQILTLSYQGESVYIEFEQSVGNAISVGKVFLSVIGRELASLSGASPDPEVRSYIIGKWRSLGLTVTEGNAEQRASANEPAP